MLSGRGLCDELITRPEESYRLCCVVVCDLETSRIGAPYIYNVRLLRVKHLLLVPTVENLTFYSIWVVLTLHNSELLGNLFIQQTLAETQVNLANPVPFLFFFLTQFGWLCI